MSLLVRRVGNLVLRMTTPPGRTTLPPGRTTGYGRQVGGIHPSGMFFCFLKIKLDHTGKLAKNYRRADKKCKIVTARGGVLKAAP